MSEYMQEFKFPDEIEAEKKVQAVSEDDVEIEIVDDTPEADRANAAPMPKDIVDELEQDELEEYSDKARFPNGPWCKVGDFILARPNSGTRLKIHGREFRLINDDSVEGIVEDPRGITRV